MRIIWRKQAQSDVREAIQYLKDRNPAAALRTSQTIRRKVGQLKDQPAMGRPGRVADTRELVLTPTPYLAVYTVDTSIPAVIILRVLHGARQWPERAEDEPDEE